MNMTCRPIQAMTSPWISMTHLLGHATTAVTTSARSSQSRAVRSTSRVPAATSYSRAAATSNGPTVRSGMANIRGHGYGYRDVERHDEGLDEALVEAAADRCGRAFRSIKE